MPLYEVTRPFSADRPLLKGEVVELDGPHIAKLIEQRYLKAVLEPAQAPVKALKPRASRASVQAAPIAESAPAPAKRGRGRPRKNPLPVPAISAESGTS